MIAAASVNWHYLLILIVPSAFVIVFTALTWYARSRRPPGSGQDQPRGSGGGRSGSGGKPSGSGGKSASPSESGKSSGSGGKPSGSGGKRSGSAGKRRRT